MHFFVFPIYLAIFGRVAAAASPQQRSMEIDDHGSFANLSGWIHGTYTTRYWDCCKPSCSWPGKGNVNKPVRSCEAGTENKAGPNEQSVCDGGKAGTCTGQAPRALSEYLSIGFVAAAVSGDHGLQGDQNCGQCFELKFVNQGEEWRHGAAGKRMIVQVTNIGYDVHGDHSFDIMIPGGGQGLFQGCPTYFPGTSNDKADCGIRYGGC